MLSHRAIKRLWANYKQLVERLMKDSSVSTEKNLLYWQNRLFVKAIMYALPTGLLVLIPCVILELKANHPYVAIVDICMLTFVLSIAVNQHLTLHSRKVLVLITVAIFAISMIMFMGMIVMGFIYLFALVVFSSLQFSDKWAYGVVGLNFLVFAVISLILFFDPNILFVLSKQLDLNRWMMFSVNFLFVNFLMAGLIRQLLKGLDQTILQVVFLYRELHREVAEKNNKDAKLTASEIEHNKAIEARNEQLKEIAYLQSHIIRRPLANIKGILELLMHKNNVVSEQELLINLDVSVKQLDVVINEIVRHSNGDNK